MKKVKKLTSVIMKSVPQDYVPTEIKIPVVSTLGIKAIIKIADIDYTPLSQSEAASIFLEFQEYHQIALNKIIEP